LAACLDPEQRGALGYLLAVMAQGERIAMEGAGLQARIAPDRAGRHFFRQQVRQERFHAVVFAGAAALLSAGHREWPCRYSQLPPALVAWRAQIVDATARGRLAESLLVQQVFLEGFGHVLLHRFGACLTNPDERWSRLHRLILGQEAQHHRVGLQLLDRELHRVPAAYPRLERIGRSLFGQAEQLLANLAQAFEALDWQNSDAVAELRAGLPAGVPGAAA